MTTVLQKKLLSTVDFLLTQWLDLDDLLTRPRFAGHSRDTVMDFLRAASTIAADKYEPANRLIDDTEPSFDGENVHLPEVTQQAWDAYVDFGFLSAVHDSEHGGLQLPHTADFASKVMFGAASVAISPAILTGANAALLLAHGSETQKRVFAHRELIGQWTGTMCMSESEAGSSLSDISTRAVPDGAGHERDPLGPRFRLAGNKMWISGADHQLAENIVHLVLAKIPDGEGNLEPGTRGISLFVVPKFVVDSDGELLERNDVNVVGLNHKLGYRGMPNVALSFGDGLHAPRGAGGAVGYLVGRPGTGLQQMFHMMNAARIEIGLGAAALGMAGYAASLDYARHRTQGRAITTSGKDVTSEQVAIIEHADVRRMLLAQKSYSEGAVALGLFCARLLDDQATGIGGAPEEARLILDILTPIVKSWPSEWCLEANSLAIQVLGGAGYTRDHQVEQYWRDNRLNMIHEGTHGIHALDLLGRKVRIDDGACVAALDERMRATVEVARKIGLRGQADELDAAVDSLWDVTEAAWATGDPRDALANATPYLQGFGHVVLAWIWLDVAVVAAGSDHAEAAGKTAAMKYFFAYELPKVDAWLAVAARCEPICRDVAVEAF